MKQLTTAFLKIFFRNYRAIFFVIFLPAGIFVTLGFLGLEGVVRYEGGISYSDYLLTGIITMALMQTGVYTVAYSLIDYRRQHILKRLAVTPLTAGQFLSAQILARFVVALVQVVVLLVLGKWLFASAVSWNPMFFVLVLLGSTMFLHFGLLIASFARDYEEAAPYTAVIGLPLVFLGDIFFPAANLPAPLFTAARFLPLKPLADLFRLLMFGAEVSNLSFTVLVLLGWFLGLTILSRWIFAKKVYK